MANTLNKLNVARHQLGTALDLFIKDRDPVAVQCLACGGSALIDAIASSQNIRTFSTHPSTEAVLTETRQFRN
ncbi:hypothetical protein [Bradyrhizobium zhanjiangense]|uniref:Uncharacterized protein n=1 Tax=Bradyrhizobium zhanjiangense TaxID=1325107 RepID=A0A4Q0QFT6_9BRAD|nr:hypothetical protein [Bradyrhizobium zhanjiangense]RXG88727.1 hypothetical protein EAS61_29105 [Bradyrhizobium zhanjiangense]